MKRLLSIAISALILAVIYWEIDVAALMSVFRGCNPQWLAISLSMVVPITLLTAWRLQQLIPAGQLRLGEANRLILAASVLNMALPTKMGDIAKAYFMRDQGLSNALVLVTFEKICDLLSLLLWCVLGLLLYPQKDWLFWSMTASVAAGFVSGILLLSSPPFAKFLFSLSQSLAPKPLEAQLSQLSQAWQDMYDYFWQDRWQSLKIATTSILLWFLHLLQIWGFILALQAWTPLLASLALSPLAILAGLLPFTFAGVGTRDAALIAFYASYFDAATAAALGLLCTCRYLLPAVAGLPFLNQYMVMIRSSEETITINHDT